MKEDAGKEAKEIIKDGHKEKTLNEKEKNGKGNFT